jgi:hypothetical protein
MLGLRNAGKALTVGRSAVEKWRLAAGSQTTVSAALHEAMPEGGRTFTTRSGAMEAVEDYDYDG